MGRVRAAVLSWLVLGLVVGGVVTSLAYSIPHVRSAIFAGLAYDVGDKVDLPPVAYQARRVTVVVYGSHLCPASRASVPLLREVADAFQGHPGFRVVFASSGSLTDTEGEKRFARDLGVGVDAIVLVPRPVVKLRLIPTVLTVDQAGRIHFVHEGAVTRESISGLVAAVRRLGV